MLSYIFTLLMPFYIIFSIIFILGVASKTKSVKATLFNLFIVILIPAHDMIPTNILAWYHCKFDAAPQTFVKKRVEYPMSIYWENNVYSGFNAEERKLMITNYLDGIHLKTMALNGDDGKVYVYHLDRPVWDEINKEFQAEKTLEKARNEYVDFVVQSEKVYAKGTMPKMNYTVTFNEVKLPTLSSKFLYSDETKVIENNTSEIVAYNKRYMRFFYHAAADIEVGNRYYYPEPMCGEDTQYFFVKVFQKIYMNTGAIAESFNSKLYRKN